MTQNVGTNDEAVTWSKHFFVIFLTFDRDTTILGVMLVENAKNVKNQPILFASVSAQNSDPDNFFSISDFLSRQVPVQLNFRLRFWWIIFSEIFS
jgi:hypothetical protein